MPSNEVGADAIRRGADELGVSLDEAQAEKLARFAELLLKWNSVHNLTALATPEQVLSHHLLDSLAVVPQIQTLAAGHTLKVLDVGSGGGLPGVPLAVACPKLEVTLIDKVQKKTAFLTQAKLELKLANVEVVHERVERLRALQFDVIVSRAFASLSDFLQLARHLLAPGGTMVAMKGVASASEIEAIASADLDLATVKLRVPLLDAERHLVLIRPL